MNRNQLENPVLGYVVIAAALIVGMLSATVFGQTDVDRSGSKHYFAIQRDQVAPNPPIQNRRWIQRHWVMGVRVKSTSTGSLVTEVISGSPAATCGVSAGDRIVAVNGKQVGWVGTKHTPLHQTIDQCRENIANVLIQEGRSRTLRSLTLRLATAEQALGHRMNAR